MPLYTLPGSLPELYRADARPRLLSAAEECAERRYLRALHAHQDRLELILVVQGTARFQIDRIHYPVAKGDLLVFNAGTLHEESMSRHGGHRVYALGIGGLYIKGLAENCLLPDDVHPVVHLREGDYALAEALCARIFRCVAALRERRDAAGRLRAALAAEGEACMRALVARLCQLAESQDQLDPRDESALGAEIRALLDRRYLENDSMQELAEQLHLTPSHMTQVFKRQSGLSPQQYVIRRRIGQAQSMLVNSGASIAEIALNCAYNSPNFFSSSFSALVGLSPARYRQLYCRARAPELREEARAGEEALAAPPRSAAKK